MDLMEAVDKDQDLYRELSVSPDGTKAVVRHGMSLWIHDLQHGTRSPLTSGNASNMLPMWSSDGMRIVFGSNSGGDWDFYPQPADGSRPSGSAAETALRPVSLLDVVRWDTALR